MRPAVLGSTQLYDLIDETLVTVTYSKRILLQKKTSKIRYEETLAFLRFFPEIFSSEVEFFLSRRVIKNRLYHLARWKN